MMCLQPATHIMLDKFEFTSEKKICLFWETIQENAEWGYL